MGVHLISPPLNLDIADQRFFQHEGFGFSDLRLFSFDHATVTFDGLCLVDSQLIFESVHHHRDRLELYYLMVQEAWQNKIENIESDERHLVIHSPTMCIYHLITELLPRLWMVRDQIQNLTVILPQVTIDDQFEQLLLPFKLKKILRISTDSSIIVKHLLLPELKPLFPVFDPEVVKQIRKFYFNWIEKTLGKSNTEGCKKAFLKSEDSGTNKIHNIKEIEDTLEGMGFEPLDVDEFDFPYLLQKLSKVDFLVSPDYHCLSFMQFLSPGSSVLELKFKDGNTVDLYSNRYWHLASCLDIKYYYQFGNHLSYSMTDSAVRGFAFDTKVLEDNVNKMLV